MGCIRITKEIKELSLSPKLKKLGLTEETVKNLVSLWQEATGNMGRYPKKTELWDYALSLRDDFDNASDIVNDLLQKDTTHFSEEAIEKSKENKDWEQRLYDNYFNYFLNKLGDENETFITELNNLAGGKGILNILIKGQENNLLRAALYNAASRYNANVNQEAAFFSEKSDKVLVDNIIGSLYTKEAFDMNDLLKANAAMSTEEMIMRVNGITCAIQSKLIELYDFSGKDKSFNEFLSLHIESVTKEVQDSLKGKIAFFQKKANRTKRKPNETEEEFKAAIEKNTEIYLECMRAMSIFPFLKKQAFNKIASINQISIREEAIKEEEREEESETVVDIYDRDVNTMSATSTVGKDVKRILSSSIKKDKNGHPILDDLGYKSFYDESEAVGILLNITKSMTTSDELKEICNKYQNKYPYIKDLIAICEKDPYMWTKVFTSLRRDELTYISVSKNGVIDKTPESDESSVVSQWERQTKKEPINNGPKREYSAYGDKGLRDMKGVGKLILIKENLVHNISNINNTTLIDEKQNKIHEFFDKEQTKRDLLILCNGIGIQATREDIDKICDIAGIKDEKTGVYNPDAMLLFENLKEIYNQIDKQKTLSKIRLDDMSLFYKGNLNQNFVRIAKLLHKEADDSSEKMIRDNGKNYTKFGLPSYITTLEKKINNFRGTNDEFIAFLNDLYGQYEMYASKDEKGEIEWKNSILQMIADARMTKEKKTPFKIVRLLSQQTVNGQIPYPKMNSLQYTSSLFSSFKNYKKGINEEKQAFFGVPILSDKSHTSFFSAPLYKFELKDFMNIDEDFNPESPLHKSIMNLFLQELQRIDLCNKRAEDKKNQDLPCFDRRGREFCYFTALNKDTDFLEKFRTLQEKYANATQEVIKKDIETEIHNFVFKTIKKDCFLTDIEKSCKAAFDRGTFSVDQSEKNAMNTSRDIKETYDKASEAFEKQCQIDPTIKDNEELLKIATDLESYKYISPQKLMFFSEKTQINFNNPDIFDYAKFAINYKLALANYIQITAGDLAFFPNYGAFCKRQYESESQTRRLDIKATWNGQRVCDDEGTFNSLILKDEEVASYLGPAMTNLMKVMPNSPLKDIIKGQYNGVNRTDGQSMRTLPSYRRVLIMAGDWNQQLEDSYNKLMNGEVDYSNMTSVFQILKPFLYTMQKRLSHIDGHTDILCPVQKKDSESPLFAIIDMLNRNSGTAQQRADYKNSKLGILNDFLIKNDIDTISFNSTIKVGISGALDLKDVPVENLQQELESNVLVNGSFNKNFVLTASYNDWGIQMPTPEHYFDKQIAVGSQMKRIVAGNFAQDDIIQTPEGPRKAGDMIKEYQKLFFANTLQQYNKIKDTFATDAALQKKLIEEMQESDNEEYKESLTLDKDGNFEMPLFESCNTEQIQQKCCSSIKKSLTKTKMRGGTATQLSCYGVNDNLNVVLKTSDGELISKETFREKYKKETGNYPSDEETNKWINEQIQKPGISVDRMECYLPVYSKSLLKYVEEDGKVNIDKMPDELRRVIGYRNPTEAKYSINNLYIKGFLPSEMGGTIILPTEITLLAGSDFDIDKLYLLFNEFEEKNVLNDKEIYLDFSRVKLFKNDNAKKIKDFFNENINAIRDEFSENGKNKPLTKTELVEKLMLLNTALMDNDPKKLSKSEIKALKNAINKNKKDIFKKELQCVKYDSSKSMQENSQKQRNNRILELSREFLQTPQSAIELLKPGGFVPIERTSIICRALELDPKELKDLLIANKKYDENSGQEYNAIKILENTENLSFVKNYLESSIDPISLETQISSQHNNMEGKEFIAITALYNIAAFELQQSELSIDEKYAVTLCGQKLTDLHTPYIETIQDGKTYKELKSFTLNCYLSASVDNGKNPTLAYMGLNMQNINTAMTLASLGYSPLSIGLLFKQPIIQKIYKEMNAGSYFSFEEASNKVKEQLMSETVDGNGNPLQEQDIDSEKPNMTKEALAKNISNRDHLSIPQVIEQLKILKEYSSLNNIGKNYAKICKVLRGDSSHAGMVKDIATTLGAKDAQGEVLSMISQKTKMFKKVETVYSVKADDDIFDFEKTSESTNMLFAKVYQDLSINEGLKLMARNFPQAGEYLNLMLNCFKTEIDNKTLDVDTRNEFFKAAINYCLSQNSFYGRESIPNPDGTFSNYSEDTKRNAYINYFPDYFRLRLSNNSVLSNNAFIKQLDFKTSYKGVEYIVANRDTVISKEQRKTIKAAWDQMFYSKDEKIRKLALHLVRYLYYTTGNDFSPVGFSDFMSFKLKTNIPEYKKSLKMILNQNIYIDASIFIDQFVRNHINTGKKTIRNKIYKYIKSENALNTGIEGVIALTTSEASSDFAKKVENDFSYLTSEEALREAVVAAANNINENKKDVAKEKHLLPKYIQVNGICYKNIFYSVEGKETPSFYYRELKTLGDGIFLKEYSYGAISLESTVASDQRYQEKQNELQELSYGDAYNGFNDYSPEDSSLTDTEALTESEAPFSEIESGERTDINKNYNTEIPEGTATYTIFDDMLKFDKEILTITKNAMQEDSAQEKNILKLSEIKEQSKVFDDEGNVICK